VYDEGKEEQYRERERIFAVLHFSFFSDHIVLVPDSNIVFVLQYVILTMVIPCGYFSPELELSLQYYP
jgi:hypothetical protein